MSVTPGCGRVDDAVAVDVEIDAGRQSAGSFAVSRCRPSSPTAAPRSRCGRGRRSAPATWARASMVTRCSPRGFSQAICSTPIMTPACCCGLTLVCVGPYFWNGLPLVRDRQHVPGAEVGIEVAEALRHQGRPDELVVAGADRGVGARVRRVEAHVLEHVEQRVEATASRSAWCRRARWLNAAQVERRRPGTRIPCASGPWNTFVRAGRVRRGRGAARRCPRR